MARVDLATAELVVARSALGPHRIGNWPSAAGISAEIGADNAPSLDARHHGAVAHLDPEQEAALRRLRAAFGVVEVLEVIDHQPSEDPTSDREPPDGQEGEQAPPRDRR